MNVLEFSVPWFCFNNSSTQAAYTPQVCVKPDEHDLR